MLSSYAKEGLLDHLFGKSTFTPPTNIFVGLSSTTPTHSGTNITEPDGNYTRFQTSPSSWYAAISGATSSYMRNSGIITFGPAGTNWLSSADITHVVLYDALTGGNFLGFGILSVPRKMLLGDTLKFNAFRLIVGLS